MLGLLKLLQGSLLVEKEVIVQHALLRQDH